MLTYEIIRKYSKKVHHPIHKLLILNNFENYSTGNSEPSHGRRFGHPYPNILKSVSLASSEQ